MVDIFKTVTLASDLNVRLIKSNDYDKVLYLYCSRLDSTAVVLSTS